MKSRFALLFISIIFLLPVGASAVTIEDLQAQINDLLSVVARLQAQLAELVRQQPSVEDAVRPSEWRHRICARLFDRPLDLGVRGDDVSELQDFLKSEGHLSVNATGYFGNLTAQAVARWQASEGISNVGVFGPASRGRIKAWCGGGNSADFRAQPQRGEAPLKVTFTATVLGNVSPSSYTIDFGDGTSGIMNDNGPVGLPCGEGSGSPNCRTTAQIRAKTNMFAFHTYTANGTYTATLTTYRSLCPKIINDARGVNEPPCMAPFQLETIGKVKIHVGAINYQNPSDDPQCKSWFDGCNTCSRQYPGGPAMCTMMACMRVGNDVPKPYCTSWFNDAGNKPPVISGISGPTVLKVNETGTWTIKASDPENQQLSYHITWGDEPVNDGQLYASSALDTPEFVQTTTFTHTFSWRAEFLVRIVVRDNAGLESKTSMTVLVGSGSTLCTGEYAPVCAEPPMPPCPPGMYCTQAFPPPRTYSNRCAMNVAGASFLYEGRCANDPLPQ